MTVVKCRICHLPIDKEKQADEWVMPSRNYYYHKRCYEDFAKKKGTISEDQLAAEVEDDIWLAAIYDYFKKTLKVSLNYNKLLNQWKAFLKKGMTAKGIYFTLRYFYEVSHGDPTKSENGIGIVPYIYDESTNYWGERFYRDKELCDNIEKQILHIQEQPRKIIYQKPATYRGTVINWEIIEDEEDDE